MIETLAEGSFGVVCVARLHLGGVERTVALKILKGEWIEHAEVLSRTRDEARLLAMLNHPYIVKVDHLIKLWGRPTIVMEYVPGASLLDIVQTVGPLPLSVAMTVSQRAAAALHAAYSRPPVGKETPLRVVHRDIKPSNIVIGIDGEVKVLDFGTARGEFQSRESQTQILGFGSVGYLAPERLEGSVKAPSIDIYSLGVTLYEILSARRMGRLPIRPNAHEQRVLERVGQMQITWGSRDADAQVRDLLVRMMAYDAPNRPTAVDVLHSCEDILRRIPSVQNISTEAFAREVVEPMYLGRVRRPPPEELAPETLQPTELEDLTVIMPGERRPSPRQTEENPTVLIKRQSALEQPEEPVPVRRSWIQEAWTTGPRWLVITTLLLVFIALFAVLWSLFVRGL